MSIFRFVALVSLSVWSQMWAVSASAEAHSCVVRSVVERTDGVRVECLVPVTLGNGNHITYFAIPTTDAARAARFVSLGLAALLSNKPFFVDTPLGFGIAPAGCSLYDCRVPTEFGVLRQ